MKPYYVFIWSRSFSLTQMRLSGHSRAKRSEPSGSLNPTFLIPRCTRCMYLWGRLRHLVDRWSFRRRRLSPTGAARLYHSLHRGAAFGSSIPLNTVMHRSLSRDSILRPADFETGFPSRLFLVPKPDDSQRPIFNLRPIFARRNSA